MRYFHSRSVAAALLLGATAACGAATAQTHVHPPAAPSTPATARVDTGQKRYTEADVRFMQGMIGHHAQAVVMTRMVPTHTGNADLQLLAQRIDLSQKDEMATMRRWLEARGEAVPAAGEHAGHAMPGMQHDSSAMHHAMMPGMLTAQELARLDAARGPEFDALFLQFMIRHHQGALVMVEQLLASPGAGQEPELFGFASDVDADQRAEIARMQRMLAATSPVARP